MKTMLASYLVSFATGETFMEACLVPEKLENVFAENAKITKLDDPNYEKGPTAIYDLKLEKVNGVIPKLHEGAVVSTYSEAFLSELSGFDEYA